MGLSKMLCYPQCADGGRSRARYWERCPLAQGYPVDGGAVCCENKTVCTEKILNLASVFHPGHRPFCPGRPPKIEKSVFDALKSVLGL